MRTNKAKSKQQVSVWTQVHRAKKILLEMYSDEQLNRHAKLLYWALNPQDRNKPILQPKKNNMIVVKKGKGYAKGQKIIDKKEQQEFTENGGTSRPIIYLSDKETHELLQKLTHVFDLPLKGVQYGFTKGENIYTATRNLVDAKSSVNMDLENAFNAVPRKAVYLIFRIIFDLNKFDAHMLTECCCHNGYLYQGCPIAPLLFNIYTLPIAYSIHKSGLGVVQYADDITIYSTEYDSISFRMVKVIKKWIEQYNMKINLKKTKFFNASCLIVVNVGLKIIKNLGFIEAQKFRKTLRKLNYLIQLRNKHGIEFTRHLNKQGEFNQMREVLLGLWAWLTESKRQNIQLSKKDSKLYDKIQNTFEHWSRKTDYTKNILYSTQEFKTLCIEFEENLKPQKFSNIFPTPLPHLNGHLRAEVSKTQNRVGATRKDLIKGIRKALNDTSRVNEVKLLETSKVSTKMYQLSMNFSTGELI